MENNSILNIHLKTAVVIFKFMLFRLDKNNNIINITVVVKII